MSNSYQQWLNDVIHSGRTETVKSGDFVTASAGKPYAPLEFVRVTKKDFTAEVAKKDPLYIYHFFPSPQYASSYQDKIRHDPAVKGITFLDALTDAFLEVFKREDQIAVDWVYEMKAWAIKVTGWINHIWGDELALRAIDRVAEIIEERSQS